MDSDGKLKALMQIFLIRVEGLTPHNFTHNREVVIQNLKSQQSKKPWLEMDDFTFVNAQTFSDPLKLGNSIADINGQICTCRRLVNLFGRKVVSFDDVVINSRVLPELILKFETLLYNIETKILDLKHEKELKFSYFEKRWFGKEKPKDHHHQNDEQSLVIHDGKKNKNEEEDDDDDIEKENNDDKGEEDSVTEVVELLRHPELNGGVLAGAFTASLISVESLLIRKSS
jgi:hypothetical protein